MSDSCFTTCKPGIKHSATECTKEATTNHGPPVASPQALDIAFVLGSNKPASRENTSTHLLRTQTGNTDKKASTIGPLREQCHEVYTISDVLRQSFTPKSSYSQHCNTTTFIHPERTAFPTPEDFDPLNHQYSPHTHRPLGHCPGCGTRLFHLPIHADQAACFECIRFD